MPDTMLTFGNNTTLKNAPEIAREIAERMNPGSSLVLNTGGVDICDITILQIIQSARRQAELSSCKLSLEKPAAGALLELLEQAGFLAAAKSSDLDFWFHGEPPR